MLRLRTLQMFNWGYSPFQVALPIGNITLLQGRNGSGKTTYLNAIAILLGVRRLPKQQALDKFVYPGEEWAFIRGAADNTPDSRGRRPFDEIIPTLENRVTLACMLERKEGGWHRSYFIVPGDDFAPNPERAVDKSSRFNQEDYRRALAHVGVRDALLNLLELGLYGLRESSRDPGSRFQFFLKLVGDQQIYDRYKTARDEWWKQREVTRHLEGRLAEEEGKLAEWEKKIKVLRQRRDAQVRKERAEKLVKHADVRDLRRQHQIAQAERMSATEELQGTGRDIAANEEQQSRFQSDYASWQSGYEEWRRARDDIERSLQQTQADLDRAEGDLQQQERQVITLQELPSISLDDAQARFQSAEKDFLETSVRVRELEEERASSSRERESLLNNKTPLPPYVNEFVQALQKANIPYLLIADLVEITELGWQRAIEGALGAERFTVIVEDENDQIQAKKIGERLNYRYFVSPPNSRIEGTAVPDSLWNVTQVSDPRARGWVFGRLAHIRRVADIEEGHRLSRQGTVTITAQAYQQEPRGGRSVTPRELVCGRAAREARLRAVEAQLSTIANEMELARQEQRTTKSRLEEARLPVTQAEARLRLPDELMRLEEMRNSVESKRQRAEEIRKTHQGVKAREDTWNQERERWAGERARLTERKRDLDAKYAKLQKDIGDAQSRLEDAERKLRHLEPELPEIDGETQRLFASETRTSDEYRKEARQAEEELGRLPHLEFEDVTEELYQTQLAVVQRQRDEAAAMREREQEHRALFDQALQDFREYIQQLFGQGMNREFKRLCALARADGEIRVENDAEDHWALQVRIGFGGKLRQELESASLSQGQEVITGLFLVLAALQAVRATPILLLDELMSTLDEYYAPLVLDQLRVTDAQCFVATPHVRPQADAIADAIWAFQPRAEDAPYAPPVGVLTRRLD
jgi:chromosome segregation protein